MIAISPPTAFSTGTDATADSFALTEDGTTLSAGTILTLDVLANDTGGSANSLWSIGSTASFDALKTPDGAEWERTTGGNLIRIVDGRVEVDLSAALSKYAGNLQALNAGDKITDSFFYTLLLADGTLGLAEARFTITGSNDAPTLTSATRSIALTEDAAQTTAAGQLTATDPDLGTALVFSGSKSDAFGALVVQKNGAWLYSLKSGGAAVQSLAEDEVKIIDYPVTVSDGKGGTATQTISVTITGTNDAPVITSAKTTAALTEDGKSATATGKITASDADHGAILTFAAAAVTENADKYGALTVDQTGKWTFTLTRTSPEVQALAKGEVKILSYTVTVTDDAGASAQRTVTITLTGTNDAPTITSAQATGLVDEGSPTTQASGRIVAHDADLSDTLSYAVGTVKPELKTYGDFTVDQTGKWVFELNNASASVQALGLGEQKALTYTVLVSDAKGGLVRQTVTVTITGTNDAPTLGTSTATAALTEDARPSSANGRIIATDIDRGDLLTYSATPNLPENAQYGSFAIDKAGRWSFALDKAAAAVQALAGGEKKVLEYDVTVADKAGDYIVKTVTITLTGTNDTATITNSNTKGAVAEDGNTQTGGILTVTDKDAGEATFKSPAAAALTGTYGHFTFDSQTGAWGYTLDNASTAVQALGATDTRTDSLVVQSADGTAHTISVGIKGAADLPPPAPAVTLATIDDSPDRYDVPDDFYTTNRVATFQKDTLSVGAGGGTIAGLDGDDTIYGGSGQDTLYGGQGNELLMGNNAEDELNGDLGNDVLYGGSLNDRLNGGSGNDTLIGGHGADTLSGGEGNDTFIFYEAADRGDAITDFKARLGSFETDRIDVSTVDADSTVAFRQQFVWGGTTATAHGLWYADSGTGTTTVYGDTDGDTTTAEFWFTLNTAPLAETDFILTP